MTGHGDAREDRCEKRRTLIIRRSLDWPQEETEAAAGGTGAGDANGHLWEESWDDDDDASEEFSKQLKYVNRTVASSISSNSFDKLTFFFQG